MSSTNRGTGRSVPRSNPEDMMWQGVRPKQQPNLLDQSKIVENQRNNVPLQGLPASQGETSINFSRGGTAGDQPSLGNPQNLSSLNNIVREEPTFPPHMQKHMSMNNAKPMNALHHNGKFATIDASGDTLLDRRSTQFTVSRKSSNNKMKKVDYSDISMQMVMTQVKQGNTDGKGRGKSLRASRFIDAGAESMLATMPQTTNGINGNGRLGSIDVGFKRQIDQLKLNLNNQTQMKSLAGTEIETPQRNRINLVHNDSIYQSSVNHSVTSGLGLTPKRLAFENSNSNTGGKRRSAAPFGISSTDQKTGERVPPILLANEQSQKARLQQQRDIISPQNAYTNQMSFRQATAGGASVISKDPMSTTFSQPEDSMFQPSEGSISQQRNRFKHGILPKIGSANPEINQRFKRPSIYEGQQSRDVSPVEQQMRQRQLSTAQPIGLKFSKSPIMSQQQRSRAANNMNETGFNWKKVSIRTNQFDGTHKTGGQSYHVPKQYQPPPKLSPGALIDMMHNVDHKGPVPHKVVSADEFERLAREKASEDDGKAMVEKTIFIVKPIYVPVIVGGNGQEQVLTGKNLKKMKSKQQKAIYMERPRPPNYSQSNTKDDSKHTMSKKTSKARSQKKRSQKMTQNYNSRSLSPFDKKSGGRQTQQDLNEQSNDGLINPCDDRNFETHPDEDQPQGTKDFKKLLNCSKIIDEIFNKRSTKIEAERRAEEEKRQQAEADANEVAAANASLRDSLAGRISTNSNLKPSISLDKSIRDDVSSIKAVKPVDTTKEFIDTINYNLNSASAGFQIVMTESKDHRWFQQKVNDQEKLNKQYGKLRKWEVAPNTFAATRLTGEELAEFKDAAMANKLSAAKQKSVDSTGQKVNAKMSRTSIDKFNGSPSGGMLSDSKSRSPVRDRAKSPGDDLLPFNKRSMGRLSINSRNTLAGVISVQDQKAATRHNQLTVERVAAMKVMTNKLAKVAKVPIQMENKFCSHIDPATSAQLIAASDLAPHNNKFSKMWSDKEHKDPKRLDWENVPRHYYSNFKTNMVRDAHFIAKQIVNQNLEGSPNKSMHATDCMAKQNPDGTITCNCKQKEQKMKEKKRFRSYIGGVRSRTRSKQVVKNAYNLYKPYRPCRRTCCANHNPLFHAQRMQHEHLQRMHASATKLMIMKVVPERPYSADSATKAFQAYVKDIDFFQSAVHGEAIQRRNTLIQKKTMRQRSLEQVEGIEERGEGEEDDRRGGNSAHGMSLLGINMDTSLRSKNTASNLNLLKKELEGHSTLDEQKAYTQLECNYLVSILKNRSVQANSVKDHMFEKIYAKARTTLKIQMKKLLLKKQFYIIDKQYKLAENEKQTSENLIKVLARCLKMYDASNELYKIIMLIEMRLEKLRELKNEMREKQPDHIKCKKSYQEMVHLSCRIHGQIRVLKDIEKCMNRPFIFNGLMYDGNHMHQQMKRKRLQLLTLMPSLNECGELKIFMKEEGEMSDVRKMMRQDFELNENEALWSSDSEMDSEGDFEDFNRMDSSSLAYDTMPAKKSSLSPSKRTMGTL